MFAVAFAAPSPQVVVDYAAPGAYAYAPASYGFAPYGSYGYGRAFGYPVSFFFYFVLLKINECFWGFYSTID